jgi:hypothetical protein
VKKAEGLKAQLEALKEKFKVEEEEEEEDGDEDKEEEDDDEEEDEKKTTTRAAEEARTTAEERKARVVANPKTKETNPKSNQSTRTAF